MRHTAVGTAGPNLTWPALAIAAVLAGCGSSGTATPTPATTSTSAPAAASDAPAWVADLIAGIAAEPVTNPPSSVLRFRYHDMVVYFRPQRCCDIPSTVWDEEGNVLCSPDGGITGEGDGRCPDFTRASTEKETVWADPRGR